MTEVPLVTLRLLLAMALVALPGILGTRLLCLPCDFLTALPLCFAVALTLITGLNVVLFWLHLNMTWLAAIWLILTLVLGVLAIIRRPRAGLTLAHWPWPPTGPRELAIKGLLVALVGISVACVFVVGSPLGGEEEIELIITRKLLENDTLNVFNVNYVVGLPPTYLLTPEYLFRALVAHFAGLDPVVLHYRMASIGVAIGLFSYAAIAASLTGSTAFGMLFLGLLSAQLLLAPPLTMFAQSPFAYQNGFSRGTFLLEVTGPLCLLLFLQAVRTTRRRWVFAALSLALFTTSLVSQAVGAIFLAAAFAIALLSMAAMRASKSKSSTKTALFILVISLAILAIFRQAYNAYHPETEVLENTTRAAILTLRDNLLSQPVWTWLQLPQPTFHFEYFKMRGTTFDHIESYFFGHFTPITLLGFLLAAELLTFRADWRPLFIFGMLVAFPLIMRIPLTLMSFLLVNGSVFAETYNQTSLFLYLALVVVLTGLAQWLAQLRVARRMVGRASVALVLALFTGALLPWLLGPTTNALVKQYDALLVAFGVLAVAALVWRRIGRLPSWDFKQLGHPSPALLFTLALLVPLFASRFGAVDDSMLAVAAQRWGKAPADAYAAYTERYDTNQLFMTRELFDADMFVRANISPGAVFAADPQIIRSIPMLANQYITHSGVPFDFVEEYFNRYYKVHDETFVANDPLFRASGELTPTTIETDLEFLRDFRVNYVLVTPRFAAYTSQVFASLEHDPRLSFDRIYDQAGYSIYRVNAI